MPMGQNAQLSTPFINLALVPEAASTILMPQRIGYARAFEMFALGEPLDAATALNAGIANRVGSLEPGKDADLALFDLDDYRELPYWVAAQRCAGTILKGRVVE